MIETKDLRSKLPTIKDGEELPSTVLEGPVLDDMAIFGWLLCLRLKVDYVNRPDRLWLCHGSEEGREVWFWDLEIVPRAGIWAPAEIRLCGWVLGGMMVICRCHGWKQVACACYLLTLLPLAGGKRTVPIVIEADPHLEKVPPPNPLTATRLAGTDVFRMLDGPQPQEAAVASVPGEVNPFTVVLSLSLLISSSTPSAAP